MIRSMKVNCSTTTSRQRRPNPPSEAALSHSPNPLSSPLADWLARLEPRPPAAQIKLGLERVHEVWRRLDVRLDMLVISVAGTNGKGSVVAMLEAIVRAAGKRSLSYTSPHLLHFAERMRIDGKPVCETRIVEALER